MNVENNLQSIIEILTELSDTRGVPRNVKTVIDEAIKSMKNPKETPGTRLNTALAMLDEISNDPNIPAHIRTQVWNVVSMLESIRESV